jgi:hypothetical protein
MVNLGILKSGSTETLRAIRPNSCDSFYSTCFIENAIRFLGISTSSTLTLTC